MNSILDGSANFKNKEIALGSILKPEHILDDMTNKTKSSSIECLVDHLYRLELIDNKKQALERVLEREELVSTSLGGGIAIPHARLQVGEYPVIAIGRHKKGIDFGSADGELVHLILLVFWAPEQAGLFNRLFGGLVTKLANPDFRSTLMQAPDKKIIADVFSDVKVNLANSFATKCEIDMLITLQLLESKAKAGAKGLLKQIALARDELPNSILSRFDRLVLRYGDALVDAPNGVCNGCNMQLSSKFASEMLKNSEKIYICEKCGRFLVLQFG